MSNIIIQGFYYWLKLNRVDVVAQDEFGEQIVKFDLLKPLKIMFVLDSNEGKQCKNI